MRQNEQTGAEVRSNGLWGGKGGSGTRANALWGGGGRGAKIAVLLGTLAAASLFGITSAGAKSKAPQPGGAVVPSTLLAAALTHPTQTFHVIVQDTRGHSSKDAGQDVANEHGKTKRNFHAISGVSADMSGKD